MLLLDLDPVGLARDRQGFSPFSNSTQRSSLCRVSFLSVAIAQVFGSALSGNSRDARAG